MPESLLLLAALCSCVVGFGWLALSLESHWRQVRGADSLRPRAVIALRIFGGISLAVSLLFCLLADHPSMAVLVWVMMLAVGVLLVAFTLTWRPRVLAPLGRWVRYV